MESVKYVIGYVEDSKRVCEIFPDWPSAFKRFAEMDTLSKTVYTVKENNEPN